jgi:hypothetical protein
MKNYVKNYVQLSIINKLMWTPKTNYRSEKYENIWRNVL